MRRFLSNYFDLLLITTIRQFYAITPAKHVVRNLLLEGLECYKETKMKSYDITKRTAELKSDNVQDEKNKIIILLLSFYFGAADRSLLEALRYRPLHERTKKKLPSHSRSFEVIQNYTDEYSVFVSSY